MLVLSSPSGAGKTTISRELLERDENLSMSISTTTRPPRPGEEEGLDYFFTSPKEFKRMVDDGEFLEHAVVFSNSYGTLRKPVEKALAKGLDVLFDVDWQGTQQLAHSARHDMVSIFVLPPSHQELERRLRARAQDTEEVIRERMSKAFSEISHWDAYDYIIINHRVRDSVSGVEAVIAAERLRRQRQTGLPDFVRSLGREA